MFYIDILHQSETVDFVDDVTMFLFFFWLWHLKKKKVWKQNVESNSIGDGVKITVSR